MNTKVPDAYVPPENVHFMALPDGRKVFGAGTRGVDGMKEVTLELSNVSKGRQETVVARDAEGNWADWLDPDSVKSISKYLRLETVIQEQSEELIETQIDAVKPREVLNTLLGNEYGNESQQQRLERQFQSNLLTSARDIKNGIVRIINDTEKMIKAGGSLSAEEIAVDVNDLLYNLTGAEEGNLATTKEDLDNQTLSILQHLLSRIHSATSSTLRESSKMRLMQTELKKFLADEFGLTVSSPAEGESFDPSTMVAADVVETDDSSLDKKVAVTVADGYVYNKALAEHIDESLSKLPLQERNAIAGVRSSRSIVEPKVRVYRKS